MLGTVGRSMNSLPTHWRGPSFEDLRGEWFEGNFEAYEEDKKRRLGEASVEPHRIKFKRFERA